MDILISISNEPKKSQPVRHFDNPYMPDLVYNPYYMLEIRETDPSILYKIKELLPLIKKQFVESDEYLIEVTKCGFKLKKRIEKGMHNQDSWDTWNKFSNSLYLEIAKTIGIPIES